MRWPRPAQNRDTPATAGTPELRESAVAALSRRYGISGLTESAVLPVIGTKELIAWLPTLLGLGAEDSVVVPELAYPTYDVGARLAGARGARCRFAHPARSPGAGPVVRELAEQPDRSGAGGRSPAQAGGLGPGTRCGWSPPTSATWAWAGMRNPLSVLHPWVCDGDHTGLLAVHSLSKSSSLAGYRAGFVAGDAALVGELLAVRKHAGMMVPRPVQAAMVAALDDDTHEREQRERYRRRRDVLLPAFRSAGFIVDYSDAGLYLWVTRGRAVPRHRRLAGAAWHSGCTR